ncbi:unnamed protein product [Rodentolepis nana]|uniref:C2H2-type domain-containing protein n=1 Tax=Rodentolepis nana TaxID=102285 RepID=A0A0R3TA96_RODNA|nr:unnamed protein product [Rodentolepis nana]
MTTSSDKENSESDKTVTPNTNRPQGNYLCPRCRAAYCELPIECVVCGITLMSAPHLARAYHHLFPLAQFIETPRSEVIAKTVVYKCPKCGHFFCADCDTFLHDFVHSCPRCTLP